LFYHHPPEQLSAEGRVQLQELRWAPGCPDGDLDDDAEWLCRPAFEPRHRPRDDEDEDRARGRPRGRVLFEGVSRWFSNQRQSRDDSRGRTEEHYREREFQVPSAK
jgi:hypothetical protein